MLRFTSAGVVGAPRTVQVRVGASLGRGIAAGAPLPGRDLTLEEVLDEVRFFTHGQRGPRGTPCDALVLSAVPAAAWGGLAGLVADARALGVRRVVVHGGPSDAFVPGVDELVVRCAPGDTIAARPGPWTAVVVMDAGADLGPLLDAVWAARPDRLVLSWPFPPDGAPLFAAEVVALLDDLARRGDAVPWTVKGVPACLLGDHAGRQARTRNRWYVDADHRAAKALLFSPDVLRFSKVDSCRFCAFDAICDGVASAWFDAGVSAQLRPVSLRDVPGAG